MPRYDADWIDFMLKTERRGSPPAEQTLTYLGLGPGQVVADVGCGPGFFTLPAAKIVAPNGLVYAIDVEPRMLELVQARATAENLAHVEVRSGNGDRIPLDDSTANLTLCALVLHDVEDRLGLVRELARVTRPNGRIAIVEWIPDQGDARPTRLYPQETARLFAEAGRPVLEVSPLGTRQYLLIAG